MTLSSLKNKLRTACTAGALFLVALPALAAGSAATPDATGLSATAGAASLPQGGDLPTIIGRFISSALALLGAVFIVLIVYAGFLWMTAQGNDEKVKQAKKIISRAVLGMILIFGAYIITNTVVSALQSSLAPPTASP